MTNAWALPVPSAVGSLDHYVQAINQFPILTAEEELMFARKLRDEDDLEAARRLVVSHLRVVVAIARGYLGYGLPHADLIQEGNIGLMKAVKRFDPERGVRLVSFAIHWIKAEIHEFVLRNWRLVRIATTKAQRKLFFNLRGMKPGLGGAHTSRDQGRRARARVKPEEVAEMELRLAGQDVSLEPAGGDDEDAYAPIAYLAEPARRACPRARSRTNRARASRATSSQRARGARSAQPPHHRSALAAGKGPRHAPRSRRGIQRFGGADPSDRG